MRALLIVLDGVGAGSAPDAARYNDSGADTLGHLFDRLPELKLPALNALGLGRILNRECREPARAGYGRMEERSAGKDSTTGHWEIAGVILDQPFATFERFPWSLMSAIERASGVTFLGNVAASGTEIIERLGPEHLRTGRPIIYTSADSVLQIAAHHDVLSADRLYEVCRFARREANAYRIGRVIARPFKGRPGHFERTDERRDFSMRPPHTILNAIVESGLPVKAIGKTYDLFAGEGITESNPTHSNQDGFEQIEHFWNRTESGLVFANLLDFDSIYGHRRDPLGFAAALEDFDRWLAGFLPFCGAHDLVIITADHGNDPAFKGTDHTREQVPLIVLHGNVVRDLGTRSTFADIAASLAVFFQLPAWPVGTPFLSATDSAGAGLIPVDTSWSAHAAH
jgi:phosphopentomutase